MATKTAEAEDQEQTPAEPADGPVLDMSDAAVKKLIKTAKARGFVTYDELNEVLPSEEVTSEQIEDTMSMLSDMGINVIDTDEAEEAPAAGEEGAADAPRAVIAAAPIAKAETPTKEPTERTDDPVRMYLREMGSVELLSREGEIAIAKRIEAGRESMIAGLCESPLTFQAIIIWRDELNDGKVLLRDIIDLDATYAGPDAKAPQMPRIGPDNQTIANITVPGRPGEPPQMPAPDAAPATTIPFKPAGNDPDGEETAARGTITDDDLDEDDDDKENWLSVAAIEAELKPKVLESVDIIAGTYKRLRRLQDQDIQFQLRRLSLSPAQERKYKKLKNEIIGEVKSLRLNRARIDSLIEQLYEINKRLVGWEGRLLRLAESHGIVREDFLSNYLGSELDPLWLNRVSKFGANGWKNFVACDKDSIKELRTQIHALASETGLEIGEFRNIVHMVQKGERETLQAKKEMVE